MGNVGFEGNGNLGHMQVAIRGVQQVNTFEDKDPPESLSEWAGQTEAQSQSAHLHEQSAETEVEVTPEADTVADGEAPKADTIEHDEAAEEMEEIAQFCGHCGQPKALFDVFCGECSKPLLRRFALILPAEIMFFLAAAVVLALAHAGIIPSLFRLAPLAFVVQFVVLYLVRLTLRQKRFLLLLGIYVILVGGGVASFSVPALFSSIAPLYLAIGVVVFWSMRIRYTNRWTYLQTLWVGLLITGLSFAAFANIEGVLQAQVPFTSIMSTSGSLLSKYTPWFTLAGFSITLAVQSGLRVSKQGVFVPKDFYPNARRSLPKFRQPANTPVPLIALSMAGHVARRAGFSFYNALVGALNTITRCLVFAWRVIQAFVVALVREIGESVKTIMVFAAMCVVRIALPLCAVYLAANVTVTAPDLLEAHAFAPTFGTTFGVIWAAINILAFTFVSILCFATISPKEFAETYVRDFSILVGYGVPLLLLCTTALWLGTLGTRRLLSIDLGYGIGHLSSTAQSYFPSST